VMTLPLSRRREGTILSFTSYTPNTQPYAVCLHYYLIVVLLFFFYGIVAILRSALGYR